MKGTVLYEVRDDVAILTVDNPPVNPLSDGVRNGLYESLVKAEEDSIIKVARKAKKISNTVLYHCVSGYPVDVEELYLLEIDNLKKSVKDLELFYGNFKNINLV